MRGFEQYNPRAAAVWLLLCAAMPMLCPNPVVIILCLIGGAALSAARRDRESRGTLAMYAAAAVITPLVNLLFSHSGSTVLLVVNHHPLTLESLLYGLNGAGVLLAVLVWMRIFSRIMTTDRIMYLLGGLWPGAALLLSMTLRFVPLFARQAKAVSAAQRGMGMYKEDNVVDDARGGLRVFSVLTTWALENGITTADSMRGRGYGSGRRTSYSVYRFRLRDGLLLLGCTAAGGVFALSWLGGALEYSFYPLPDPIPMTSLSAAGYGACALLTLVPAIIEAEVRLRWRCLISKI